MACTHKKGRDFYANDPEMLARYDLAIKHTEIAREEGKSSEEIHAMFKRIMDGTSSGKCAERRAAKAAAEAEAAK